MKSYFFALAHGGRIRALAGVFMLLGGTLSGLLGCAGTQWERAAYQGVRYGSDQCQLKRRPTDAPCAELLDYGRYEQGRAKAKNETAPATRRQAIEDKQP